MGVDFGNFFDPKCIAVIGASRNPSKVGHVIVKSLLDGGFKGKVIPINTEAESILGLKAYPSVSKVYEKINLGIVSVPAKFVLSVVKECNRKGVKDVIVVSAGFAEVGNHELEEDLKKYLNKNKMRCIGVNCLGVFDAYNNIDTLFLPRYKLRRPKAGGIGFVCQSGAVGSATLDIATQKGHRFSKFISYGNATQIDESDLIEYLGNDDKTKVICLYLEGVRNGDKFFQTVKSVSKKKPIVVLKGGLSERGQQATMSHTGSLAGKKEVYFGVFKQAGMINADSLEEMFHIASLVGKDVHLKGARVQIITNGGGYGIISTDNIVDSKNLEMAQLTDATVKRLRESFSTNVNISNPLDLVADATTDSYRIALEACISDKNVDVILLIVLYQTPLVKEDVVEVISGAHRQTKKPIVVVSTGSEFTEMLSESLREDGVSTFNFPEDAIKAIDKLMGYEKKRSSL